MTVSAMITMTNHFKIIFETDICAIILVVAAILVLVLVSYCQ